MQCFPFSAALRHAGPMTGTSDHAALPARRHESLFMLRNRNAMPSSAMISEAAEHLRLLTGIRLSLQDMGSILSLYPKARIMLAIAGSTGRIDVQDALGNAAADFFLGESWPDEASSVASETFAGMLRQQAIGMGFEVDLARTRV